MSYNIIATPKFSKELKRLTKKFESLKIEFAHLIEELANMPSLGTPLGNNCFKIRIAIASKGKGKSGGARLITYVYVAGQTVFLLFIYDKSEQADVTEKEIKAILKLLPE